MGWPAERDSAELACAWAAVNAYVPRLPGLVSPERPEFPECANCILVGYRPWFIRLFMPGMPDRSGCPGRDTMTKYLLVSSPEGF